jgi:large subunit ribosomal protein L6
MSRKGKIPVAVPKGVTVTIDKDAVTVKGPKGSLSQKLIPEVDVQMVEQEVVVATVEGKAKRTNFQGLYRSLIANMVQGATQGFEKKLEMIGVGYRAAVQGHDLVLQIGFSHPVKLPIPSDLKVAIEKGTMIAVSGVDKQRVGWFAANIRSVRPPEPYQGKNIRYEGEVVRKKAGKAGKAGKK